MNPLLGLSAWLVPLAAAAAPAKKAPEGPSMWTFLAPLLIMFAVIYLFAILPQRKRDRARREMLGTLKKNDEVVTTGGIHGTVTVVRDREVVLKVDDVTKLTVNRSAIAYIKTREGEEQRSQ
jgi:preprotein translocase subunit YajC